jgi:oligopeptide/dipeptide ABC transporter ATP-binding protein
VENLTAGFQSGGRFLPAVSDVSFHLSAGETLGLVGESGSGKSVTALCLLRLLEAPGVIRAGRVLFQNTDILSLDDEALQRVRGASIGFVFQEPSTALNPVFTVGDHVAEVLVAHGRNAWPEARAKAVQLLDAVRIPDAARRARDYPHQLSGGMRQRVMIAIALACEPPLLIADEPTTALDVTIQAEILDLLRELRDRYRLALLLITHDLGVIAETADRVAVMYGGRIVEEGPVGTLFDTPSHPYTRGLLASMPGSTLDGRPRAIPGAVPSLASLPPGCAFEPRCGERLPICARDVPARTDLGDGHWTACHAREGAGLTAQGSRRDDDGDHGPR